MTFKWRRLKLQCISPHLDPEAKPILLMMASSRAYLFA